MDDECRHETIIVILDTDMFGYYRRKGWEYWQDWPGDHIERIDCEDCGEDVTEELRDEIQRAFIGHYGIAR